MSAFFLGKTRLYEEVVFWAEKTAQKHGVYAEKWLVCALETGLLIPHMHSSDSYDSSMAW